MIMVWIFTGICVLLGLANVVDGQKNITAQRADPKKQPSFFMPHFLQSPYITLGLGLVASLFAYQSNPTDVQFIWILFITFLL